MTSHANSASPSDSPLIRPPRAIVLHDDHLTAARDALVARAIADEMELGMECETKLWNLGLLDSLFGPVIALDVANAELLILAVRDSVGFSLDLRVLLRRWSRQSKGRSAALIAVLEHDNAHASEEARDFLEQVARGAEKEFFAQPVDLSSIEPMAKRHEFLWVL